MAKRVPLVDVRTKSGLDFYSRELRGHLRKASRQMVKALGEEVKEGARRRVAVHTGRLRDSIHVRARKVRNEDHFMATVRTGYPGVSHYRYGAHYGMMQERGAPGFWKGGYTFTPYMRPAHDEAMHDAPKILEKAAAAEANRQATKRGRPRKVPTLP